VTPAAGEPPCDTPAGSVRKHAPQRPAGLGGVSSLDLAAELLHRLQAMSDPPLVLGEPETRAGLLLQRTLERALDSHSNRVSRTRYRDLFATFHVSLGSAKPALADATYVDLGCGATNPLGASFLFLAAGARRAIAIDADPPEDSGEALRLLADLAALLFVDPGAIVGEQPLTLASLLANLQGFDLAKLRAGDQRGLAWGRLEHRHDRAEALSLADGEADVVMSNAFLEHVAAVDAVLAELARVTRSGGLGVHVIDGRDHRSLVDPSIHRLAFLELPATEQLVHACNRVRPHEFARRFERAGFTVVELVPFERVDPEPIRSRLAPPFAQMAREELAVTMAKLVVRRR